MPKKCDKDWWFVVPPPIREQQRVVGRTRPERSNMKDTRPEALAAIEPIVCSWCTPAERARYAPCICTAELTRAVSDLAREVSSVAPLQQLYNERPAWAGWTLSHTVHETWREIAAVAGLALWVYAGEGCSLVSEATRPQREYAFEMLWKGWDDAEV